MHYSGVATLEGLVDRYLVHGDESAIEAVVRRTQPRLLRTARRIWPADADDCVQTAYLSLVHKRGAGLDAAVWPWLITAVVRTAYRHRAQHRRREEIATRLVWAKDSRDPMRGAIDAEETRRLRNSIDRLPSKLRDAVVLRYLEELSTRETAFLLGITEANVRVRLQRARSLLRARLPMRLAYALFAVPWIVADSAEAATVKAGAAVVALATAGVFVAAALEGEPPALRHVAVQPAVTPDPVRPESPASESAQRVLTGRVVDPDGHPVRDALVVTRPMDRNETARSTRTGAGGRFEGVLDGDAYAWSLFVEAPGLSPAVRRRLQPAQDLLIRLEPATSLAGTVMGLSGEPIAGATIRWHSFWEGIHIRRETRSGGDGHYRLEGLPAPGTFVVWIGAGDTAALVDAPGHAPLAMSLSASEEQNFVLVAGATLRGMVVDHATSQPVAGARVPLWSTQFARRLRDPHKGWVDHPLGYRPLQETRSRADGTFTLSHVPSGGFHNSTMQERCQLGATAPGRISAATPLPFARNGETKDVELRLVPTVAVRGRVVDRQGAPLPGVPIRAAAGDGFRLWPQLHATSDADGAFRIEGLPAVEGLILMAGGARRRPVPGEAVALVAVPRPAADFLVVDAGGRPIAGAAIDFAHTDREGRCRVEGSGPTRKVVRAHGFAPGVSGAFEPSVSAPPLVRVVLRPGYTLSGFVRWEDGLPARSGVVRVYNGRVPLADARAGQEGLAPLVVYGSGWISEEGTFEIGNLPPGPYHVVASYQTFLNEAVEAQEERATSGVTLTLSGPRRSATRCEVKGTVRDAETGKLVPSFRAYVRRHPVRATAPGEWSLTPVDAGTYEWFLVAAGYARFDGTLTVKPDQKELRVDVELHHFATVRGVVTGAPPGAKIRLTDETWEWGDIATVAPDGTYEIRNVRPGRYLPEVYVENDAGFERCALRDVASVAVRTNDRALARDFAVVPGGTVEIVVLSTTREALTIHDSKGRLVAGANAALVDRKRPFARHGTSRWSLPAGRYVARLAAAERAFEVVAGGDLRIELGAKD
ncbi:MAG: sigma-70 family RNA polymerase sigma factor [Planctomycetota bacterium]